MKYTKPFQTFEELADKVQKRGLGGDRATLMYALQTVGYYRLSGYWYPFHTHDVFHDGATIEKVMRIYDFDRHFRLIMLNALEHIEIYFRTQLAHKISRDHGPFGYLENKGLPRLENKEYCRFYRKCHDVYERSREQFVVHYMEKYGDNDKTQMPPLWLLVSAMDFGQIVTMYKGASVKIRNEIASDLGVSSKVLDSWLLTINTARNICAHHGRLWNRAIGTKPIIPNASEWHDGFKLDPRRAFTVLVICQYLLNIISPTSGWRRRLDDLLQEYPDISRRSMGFVKGWEKCSIWNNPING